MGLVAAFLLYLFWRRARGWNVGGGDDIGGPDPGEGGGMHGAEGRGLLDALGEVLGQEINDGDGQGGGGNPLLIRRGVPSDLQLQALFLSGGDLGADFLRDFSIVDSTCNISVKLILGAKIKRYALEQLKLTLERYDSRFRDMSLPWLLSLAENGHGKLVPRNAFSQTNYIQCYKMQGKVMKSLLWLAGFAV
ncbi:uncharacterized protein LOC119359120 [Triticum dicoccoides]|uniref:uncharacterized protein LOC119359120 n=1 Tax=Triticum dicoccoides TaxID=85692 RepID=UPI00188F67C4|nr:uncharacterized protein LOC119359120 [Triticum dicoccoides]